MRTQEIQSEDWQEFCKKFTDFNHGSLLTVEMIAPDGVPSEIARDRPLDKMTYDKTDACNDIISISLGEPNQKKTNHFVIEPIHLRLTQAEGGKKLLQMTAENGITLVTFHSGRFPQLNNFSDEK